MTATTTPLAAQAIREMPAGREMDCLIAVMFFGWDDTDGRLTTMARNGDLDLREYGDYGGPVCMTYNGPPLYSTDLAAAFQVAEKRCLGIARVNGGWTVFRIKPGADFTTDRLYLDLITQRGLCTATP